MIFKSLNVLRISLLDKINVIGWQKETSKLQLIKSESYYLRLKHYW